MYKHILVPTDGSSLSLKAIKTAASLAKETGAKITALYVIPPYMPPAGSEGMSYYADATASANYKEATEKNAARALGKAKVEAEAAQVPCATTVLTQDQPWNAIVRTARAKKCDLIVMASHGRRGLAGLLLGSETSKVLTHSKTPVLVCR